MARRFVRLLLVVICCAALGSLQRARASTPRSGLMDYTIRVGGYQRVYHVHVPPAYTGQGVGGTSVPLLVALHAANDSGTGMAGLTHFNDVADRFNFIATYPDALNGMWNTYSSAPQDDFAFISAMIQQMRSTFAISDHQVYATGFSNGAIMTEEVGCNLSSQFAAIASVSGHMSSTFPCPLTHPMPFLTFHGTSDPVYPYNGWSNPGYSPDSMGAVDAENKWASFASCTGPTTTTNLPDVVPTDGTTEQLRAIGGCKGGIQIQLYIINNGGHTWPGGVQYAPASLIGLTSRDIDASTLIWQFFARVRQSQPLSASGYSDMLPLVLSH